MTDDETRRFSSDEVQLVWFKAKIAASNLEQISEQYGRRVNGVQASDMRVSPVEFDSVAWASRFLAHC